MLRLSECSGNLYLVYSSKTLCFTHACYESPKAVTVMIPNKCSGRSSSFNKECKGVLLTFDSRPKL